MVKLSIFYAFIYICFGTYLFNVTSVSFKGNEFIYIVSGFGITAGFGLFYAFSLLMLAIQELVNRANEAIEESRRLRNGRI